MNDDELFVRLIYYATVHLNRQEEDAWLLSFGYLLDLWEVHRQFMGWAKPKEHLTLDDVLPF